MMRVLTLLSLLLAAAGSGGCTLATFEVMEHVDQAVSKLAQSDCELIRAVHLEPICDSPPEHVPAEVYCYRSLGAVDCYAARDPLDRPIVSPPPSRHAAVGRF